MPVWKKLISDGAKELPITDERMTRFHFEMKDVVCFVDDSIYKMQGSEIFLPKLPSIRIVDVAKALDMPYRIIGARANEKIHEEIEPGVSSGDNERFLTVEEIRQII